MWLTLKGKRCRFCHAIPAWVGLISGRLFCHSHAVNALTSEVCRPISFEDGL